MPDIASQISEAKSHGYSDDEIVGFLSKRADLAPKIKEARSQGYAAGDIVSHLGGTAAGGGDRKPEASKDSYLSQVGTGLWNTIKGLLSVGSEAGQAALNPLDALEHLKNLKKMVLDPQFDQAIAAADRFKSNEPGAKTEAVGHALAALIPGIGPAAANIGEKLGDEDYTGAAADATVLAAPLAALHVAGPIARAAAPVVEPIARDAAAFTRGAASEAPAALMRSPLLKPFKESIDAGVSAVGDARAAARRALPTPVRPSAVAAREAVEAAAPLEKITPPDVAEQVRQIAEQRAAQRLARVQAAEEAPAPPVEAAAAPPTPGQLYAESRGENWAKLPPQAKQFFENYAQARAEEVAAQAANPKPAAAPAPSPDVAAVPPASTPPQTIEQLLRAELEAKNGAAAPVEASPDTAQVPESADLRKPLRPPLRHAPAAAEPQAPAPPVRRMNVSGKRKAETAPTAQPDEVTPEPVAAEQPKPMSPADIAEALAREMEAGGTPRYTPAPAGPKSMSLAQQEASMMRTKPAMEEPRSRYTANGEPKSKNMRKAEIKQSRTEAKAERWAQALNDYGLTAEEVGKIPGGRMTLEQIGAGATPSWENYLDYFIAKGAIDADEVVPKTSMPLIIQKLRTLEKQTKSRAAGQ